MANSVAFPCSIFMLIIVIYYTDGQWNNERRNDKRSNHEKRKNERSNDGRQNDEKWNDYSSEEDERSGDERQNNERRNDERRDNEKRNDEKLNDDSSEEDNRSNDEKRNDDSSEESKRSNDERQNNERRNDERRSDEKRNDRKRNVEEQKDGSSQEDKRSNNERRNDERRNDKERHFEKRNDEKLNDDSTEEDDSSNDERRNDEKRNDGSREERKRSNDDSSEENKRSNDERRNDERWNPFFHHSPLMKMDSDSSRSDEKRNDDSIEEDRFLRFADKCPADKKADWSYRGNNGPLMWIRTYSACGGRAQSPIAINSYDAIFHENIEKLRFQNYHIPVERATIENNGHTIHITPRDDVQRSIHSHGRTYRLKQLHFHWGDNKTHSSEHTINFIHYALEMHLVHQSRNGRTAVVAVFFKEQSQTSKELQNIIQKFPKLMYKDNSTEYISAINLNNLLPANPASFYRYEGSLTTPPCTEGVQWLLLRKIMPVGTKQMAEFRKLYSSSKADSNDHCRISNNYRPLQSLNGRKVVLSQ